MRRANNSINSISCEPKQMSGRISGSVEGQGMATLGGVSEVCGEEGTVNVWRKSNALKGWGQRDPHVRKPTLGKQSVQLQPVTVAISHPGYPALQQTTNPRLLPQPMKAARPHMRGNRRKNGRHNASLARFRLKQLGNLRYYLVGAAYLLSLMSFSTLNIIPD